MNILCFIDSRLPIFNYLVIVTLGQQNENYACQKDSLMYKENFCYILELYQQVSHIQTTQTQMSGQIVEI